MGTPSSARFPGISSLPLTFHSGARGFRPTAPSTQSGFSGQWAIRAQVVPTQASRCTSRCPGAHTMRQDPRDTLAAHLGFHRGFEEEPWTQPAGVGEGSRGGT